MKKLLTLVSAFSLVPLSGLLGGNPVRAQEGVPSNVVVTDTVDGDATPLRSNDGTGDAEASNAQRRPDPRIQANFPEELILPLPAVETIQKSQRFVEGTIDPELPLNLVIGRPKVLQLAQAPLRIFIPDDDVIRTEVVDIQSGREIAVTGLKSGSTTLILWFEDPTSPTGQATVSYLVRVFSDPILARPIESLEKELNEKFPNSYIELDQIEDRMIVKGQTPDTIEMGQILQVLAGARGVTAGLLRPNNPVQETQPVRLTQTFDLQADDDPLMAEEAAAQRRRVIDPLALARAGIINQLKVVGEQQVMLKVTVAEVNRNAARSIGLNFAVDNNNGFTVFQSLVGNLSQAGGGNQMGGANVLASLDMGQVRLAVEALRRLNLSRTLAEPNLVTMNGQPADFQAGGRFPVPVISSGGGGGNGQNLQGVSFVPFGVQLQFTPYVQDRDVIRLQLNAEVSTRDESLGTAIGGSNNGTQVSGLNSRNFATTVKLKSGQTIAVAGLLQTNYGASTDRVPFWGDLPIIGATGGVNRSSSGEQELVILVTPYLVAAEDACDVGSLPGSDVYEPTDIEFYIANRLESRRSSDFRASVRTDHARQKRVEQCLPETLMIGQIGPTDRCYSKPATSAESSANVVEPIQPIELQQNTIIPIEVLSDN